MAILHLHSLWGCRTTANPVWHYTTATSMGTEPYTRRICAMFTNALHSTDFHITRGGNAGRLHMRLLITLLAACISAYAPQSQEHITNTLVIVHRAAHAEHIENTLPAIRDAHAWGADGIEIDIRRSADGILYLFHDDMLDIDTSGVGPPNQHTLESIRELGLRDRLGRPTNATIPTLAEALDAASELDLSLHLDIKEPDLEQDIARELDQRHLWSDVVFINRNNGERLREHSEYQERPYKGPLYHAREDWSPQAIRTMLHRPGEMVIVDDPRLTARLLGRELEPRIAPAAAPVVRPRTDTDHRAALERLKLNITPTTEGHRRETIEQRVVACRALARTGGELDAPTVQAIEQALQQVIDQPIDHPSWMFDRADAAAALRALADLEHPAAAQAADQTLNSLSSININQASPGWWRLRDEALRALGRAGQPGIPRLKHYLQHDAARFEQQRAGAGNLRLATEALIAASPDDHQLAWLFAGQWRDTQSSNQNLAIDGTAIESLLRERDADAHWLIQRFAPSVHRTLKASVPTHHERKPQ